MNRKIIVAICIASLLFCLFTGITSAKPSVAWEKILNKNQPVSYHVNFFKEAPDGGYLLGGNRWYTSGSGISGKGGFWLKINSTGGVIREAGGWHYAPKPFIKIASVYQMSKDQSFDDSFASGDYIIVGNDEGKSAIGRTSSVYEKEWHKAFDYEGLSALPPSVRTSDNKIILVGHSKGRIRLTKIDKTGDIEWDKYISRGAYACDASSIVPTSDGGYVLAGGTNTGEKLGPGKEVGDVDLYDTYLIKIDPEGNVEWEKRIDVGHSDGAHFIKQTPDGGFIISGKFGAAWYDPKKGLFLMKTDSKGNKKWVKEDISGKIVETTSDSGCILIDGSLYKIDQKGNIVWKVESVGYDAIRTADGGFLAVASKSRSARSVYYPHETIYHQDILLKKLEEPIIEIIDIFETENSLEQQILGKVFNYVAPSLDIHVNGEPQKIDLRDGEFDEIIHLKEGKNKIEFVIDGEVHKTINISTVKFEIPKETYSFTNSEFKKEFGLTYVQYRDLLQNYLDGTPTIVTNLIADLTYSPEMAFCYGMSSTAIVYHEGMEKPVDKDAYEMSMEEAAPNIRRFQVGVIDNILNCYVNYLIEPDKKVSYDQILNSIEKAHKPVVLTTWTKSHDGLEALYDIVSGEAKSHAVVAYKTYELDGKKRVVVYENKGKYPSVEDCMGYAIFDFSKANAFNYLMPESVEGNVREVPYAFYPTVGTNTAINTVVDNFLLELIKLLHSHGLKLISVSCPVNVSITDESGRVIADDGTNQIPNAKVIATDDVKLFFVPGDLTYSVNVDAYGEGNFTLTQFSPIDDKRANATEFNSSVTPQTKASILISPETVSEMKIDYDGNGTIDEEKEPVIEIIEVSEGGETVLELGNMKVIIGVIIIAFVIIGVFVFRRQRRK
jgi:hypothetical protein